MGDSGASPSAAWLKISDLSASVTAKPTFQQIRQELSALGAPQSQYD
jgi:hypothetical protein